MPYIAQEVRETLQSHPPSSAGELNYMLTCLCLEYLNDQGESYQVMNDIVGALESCKLEFYRRAVAPYEKKKIKENGDVY